MTKTLDLDTLQLRVGSHSPPNGAFEACVMEAVAYIADEPWSDSPKCASPVIGAFLRAWNDTLDDDPRQNLKQYIPRLVGSRGTSDQEDARAWLAMDWLVRTYTPVWLRLAGLTDQADRVAGLLEFKRGMDVPSVRPVIDAVRTDAAAAWDAAAGDATAGATARATAGATAWATARATAWATAGAAAWDAAGGDAAWDAAAGAAAAGAAAARATAWAAARATAWAAAGDAAGDAAGARLAPAVTELQAAAHSLIDRMLAVTEDRRVEPTREGTP